MNKKIVNNSQKKVSTKVVRRNNTQGKSDVLAFLEKSSSALSQNDLQKKFGDKYDRVTLYRILSSFEKDGLVHKSIDLKGIARFAKCHHHGQAEHKHHDMHLHFSCQKCKKVTCLDEDALKLNLPKKYTLLQANFMVEGLCNKCS
jgi:Fur family transcriptional regulator, ferric uptake regulator